jgi:tetratricopeptide (TPR) repeat protein
MAEGLAELKALLQSGKIEEARALVDRLVDTDGGEEVLAAFEGLYLAEGVRRAVRARELRREAIRKLPPGELDYEDDAAVAAAFEASVQCFDRVLARNPRQVKAMILRAGVLHLQQRDRERTVRLLREALAVNPEARDAQMNLRKVMRACAACGDTGFCRLCHGRGMRRRWLGGKGPCESCLGEGTCRRCSLV